MYERHETGRWGEDIACDYLVEQNYSIVERNFSCRQGEIDIIACDKNKKELVFVEVKTRKSYKYGSPVDAVNKYKQKHIYWAAQFYIYSHNINHTNLRFDVIEICAKNNLSEINHIKQIF